MNCKPFEMAIRIKAPTTARIPAGTIVRVLDVCGPALIYDACGVSRHGENVWDVEFGGKEISPFTGLRFGVPDEDLRPIRPDESPEEITEAMRLLTQLPQKEKV